MLLKTNRFFTILIIILSALSIISVYGCCLPIGITGDRVSRGSKSQHDPDSIVAFDEATLESDYSLPDTRPFHMGFTPFPYDFTQDALEFTYANINYHSDILAHHFDNGVPWEEALNNSDLPNNLMYDFNDRISRTGKDKKIYLAVTPLSTYRDKIAGYWGESEHMELTGKWSGKSFSDPKIIEAYLNYCKFIIEKFEPQYFAYGIEVNMLGYHDQHSFRDFLILAENIYSTLKESYPDLPVFLTFQLETFFNHFDNQESVIESLLPFTDYIGISTYPFGNFANPLDIPADWFSRLYSMAPEKPVAICETAFLAEDLSLERFNGNTIEGSQKYQLEYLYLIFNHMAGLDCKFIIWFVIRDYDQLWLLMEEQGADEIFKSWRDTGLIDEKENPRRALGCWDSWLPLPVR